MKVGVLGTMVWDEIDHPDGDVVERWGGIAYSLAAAAAALPRRWTVRPIVKVGADLADGALAFLDAVPGLDRPGAVVVVQEPNNRVHLRYLDRQNRQETLRGGVPGWSWEELRPRLDGLDALYVNLISGFELDLVTARRFREDFRQPTYVDLHSLLLGVAPGGGRVPRALPDRVAWLTAFDVVQMNERELALVADGDDPDDIAGEAVRRRGGAILVTRGPAGALWYAAADRARPWRSGAATPRRGRVHSREPWAMGDPTGCGDVWGATCFIMLLRGRRLSAAMATANGVAGSKMDHRGADGLYHHLRTRT